MEKKSVEREEKGVKIMERLITSCLEDEKAAKTVLGTSVVAAVVAAAAAAAAAVAAVVAVTVAAPAPVPAVARGQASV
ncbi:hypothetical protein V1477_011192 [Vespula maculifrons]|uniref:Uncharacterized protein n=1 Tax=Vespula maculifrons TaxID=7453 RepID=A0ABD2C5Z4_VESMC